MSKRFLISFFSILVFSATDLLAQEKPIYLNNSSFEDMARPGREPRSWYDCGAINFPEETPPDVHPVLETPAFEVTKRAQDGDTYLGMVVRENDSWESVAQRLSTPLQAGKCYTFSIYLATSKIYKSSIRGSNEVVNFTKPLKLRIWGGRGYCNKGELLAESALVTNSDWQEYKFKFEPKQRSNYIVLEAFFKTPQLVPPNGNILLDNASPIQMIPCDEEIPLVKKPEVEITNPRMKSRTVSEKSFNLLAKVLNVKGKRKITFKVNGIKNRSFTYNSNSKKLTAKLNLRQGENKVTILANNEAGVASDEATIIYEPAVVKVDPVKPNKSEMEEKLDKLKPGETLRVDELFFDVDSYVITEVSLPILEDIYSFLEKNKKVKVEIGGHTNRNCDTQFCNELSTNRAKAVVDFLVSRGINSSQLSYKGYGKTEPLTFSPNPKAQAKNQRVEIKILSIGS